MRKDFKNTPVWLNGATIHADTASISESVGFEPIPTLGSQNKKLWASTKPEGEMSFTFLVTNADDGIRSLTGCVPVSGSVGGYGFVSGFLTSYSINGEADSLLRGSASFSFFQAIEEISGQNDLTEEEYAHGLNTLISTNHVRTVELTEEFSYTVETMFFNDNFYSFDYSISQSITPYFLLGESEISSATLTDGSVSISLEGSGLGGAISYPCSDYSTVSIGLKDVCENKLGAIVESGMQVEDSSLALSSDKGLEGSISLRRAF